MGTTIMVRKLTLLGLAGLLAASTACDIGVEKSANPLSPSIAGPLPGVAITPPYPREPVNGIEVLTTSLPVKLAIDNSQSNSPRPFWYVIELAADSAFSTKLYTSDRVSPDPSGRTIHTVPGQLPDGVTYYWRAQALDGANASEYSTVVYFQVVQPTIIDPPVPASPIGGATTPNRSPDFVVTNGRVSGPAGVVTYYFQVANDAGFASMAAAGAATRSGGATTTVNLGQLAENRTFYWRAFGSNGRVTSGYSSTQTFKTPVTTTPPGGGGCSGRPAGGWPSNGPAVVAYVTGCYPSYLVAGVSSGQRSSNMEFLRNKMIESGICGGMDLGWNLKRGGPEISMDFIVHRQGGSDYGVDIAADWDNTSVPLRLQWIDGTMPYYATYTPRPSCQ